MEKAPTQERKTAEDYLSYLKTQREKTRELGKKLDGFEKSVNYMTLALSKEK